MSDHRLEELSALVDGDLPRDRRQLMMHSLREDAALRAAWSRYHLIGEAMRSDLPARVDHGLADRVSAALQSEPAILAPRARNYVKPLAGLAVAASVALVAVLGVQRSQMSTQEAMQRPMAQATPMGVQPQVVEASQPIDGQAAAINRLLNRYLVNHNELRANAPMQGMLPYARVVGFEQSEQSEQSGQR